MGIESKLILLYIMKKNCYLLFFVFLLTVTSGYTQTWTINNGEPIVKGETFTVKITDLTSGTKSTKLILPDGIEIIEGKRKENGYGERTFTLFVPEDYELNTLTLELLQRDYTTGGRTGMIIYRIVFKYPLALAATAGGIFLIFTGDADNLPDYLGYLWKIRRKYHKESTYKRIEFQDN